MLIRSLRFTHPFPLPLAQPAFPCTCLNRRLHVFQTLSHTQVTYRPKHALHTWGHEGEISNRPKPRILDDGGIESLELLRCENIQSAMALELWHGRKLDLVPISSVSDQRQRQQVLEEDLRPRQRALKERIGQSLQAPKQSLRRRHSLYRQKRLLPRGRLGPIKIVSLRALPLPNLYTRSAARGFRGFKQWSALFAKIHAPCYKSAGSHYFRPWSIRRRRRIHGFSFIRFASELEVQRKQGRLTEYLIEKWMAKDQRERLRDWQPALLLALHESPCAAAWILRDILRVQKCTVPLYAVHDALEHIVVAGLDSNETPSAATMNTIYDTIRTALDIHGAKADRNRIISQKTYYTIFKHCDREQLRDLVDFLRNRNISLSVNTRLHAIAQLAGYGELKKALKVLGSIPAEELSNDRVQSVCVGILRTKFDVENIYALRTDLLLNMIDIGVRPNRQMHNVALLNAMEAGDRKTAWSSYETARDNGMMPDSFTYDILLQGVKFDDDQNAVNSIYNTAKTENIITPWLGFSFLHAEYLLDQRRLEPKPFNAILSLYCELFDIRPLQELGILREDWPGLANDFKRMSPDVYSLGIMLQAWCAQYHRDHSVQEVYERYIHHVISGHPVISQLASNEYASNAFLIAFGKSYRTLHLCTKVIQNMLKPPVRLNTALESNQPLNHAGSLKEANANANSNSFQPATSPSPVTPTVYTWTILLHAFLRHRQVMAAEKVLAMMKSNEIEPNEVTWKTLINGYANLQDSGKLAITVQQMQKDGFQADSYTLTAIAKVTDRQGLLRAFERASREDTSAQIQTSDD